MQYKTVRINVLLPQRVWRYSISTLPGNFEREKRIPMALGFYHYPASMDDRRAFEKLKDCMVKRHRKEIALLQKSLDKLIELTYQN